MSYAKSVFFIPVWYDAFAPYTKVLAADPRWTYTDTKKHWAQYLYKYASGISKNAGLFASFTLKNPSALNVYLFADKIAAANPPVIEDVRLSCFATGVGFMEFWVSYDGASAEDVAEFSYYFKKAKPNPKTIPEGYRALYSVAEDLLPDGREATLFFSASAWMKYECNCFHFLHLDQEEPSDEDLRATVYRLSRSYLSTMPAATDSAYDMMYRAGEGDYWGGSAEGLVNVTYDAPTDRDAKSDYYLHTLKPQQLQTSYYFMYLLLLNQKYTAIEYIRKVSESLDSPTKEVESLNRRIIQLKNTFSFNVISDDSVVQNIYAKMYGMLEIRNLLEDVIENESQMAMLQKAKQMEADRFSSKCLFGLSILSIFSALIDAASYFDRFSGIRPAATVMSILCVLLVTTLCIVLGVRSMRK